MHVLDAAKATVDNYPGGVESLAPRLGMSAGILRNKINPNCSTNHLTLDEAARMISLTRDTQIIQALGAENNLALVPLEAGDADISPTPVMNMILKLGVAEGEFTRTLHDALADGHITGNEMCAIGNAALADQKALIGLIARLRKAMTQHGARVTL